MISLEKTGVVVDLLCVVWTKSAELSEVIQDYSHLRVCDSVCVWSGNHVHLQNCGGVVVLCLE